MAIFTSGRYRSSSAPVNTLLAATRSAVACGATTREVLEDLLGYQIDYPGAAIIEHAYATATPEEREHALRVLELCDEARTR